MNKNDKSAGMAATFLTTACIIPAVSSSVGVNWLPVLVAALGAMLLYECTPEIPEEKAGWLKIARIIVITMLLSHYMRESAICWPGRGAKYAVPALLALLALYAVCRGEQVTVRSTNVMRYGVFAVLAIILYAGMQEVKWESIMPTGELPRTELLIALTLPLLAKKEERSKCNAVPIAAILTAVITAGTKADNLYHYSKMISIRGITEHMESIAAGAITVGYYALLSCLMISIKQNMKQKNEKWKLAVCVIAAYIIMITEIEIKGLILAGFAAVMWVVMPLIYAMKRKMSKFENSA